MAEVFRIEIPVDVKDNTSPGLDNAGKKLTGFEKSIERTKKKLESMNQTRWQLTVYAIDRTQQTLNRMRQRLFGLVSRTWNISIAIVGTPLRILNNIKNSLLSLPTLIGAVLTGLTVQKGVITPLQMVNQLQQAQIGFRTFLGQSAGDLFMQDIRQFAMDTPFGEKETREMAVQLLPIFKDNPQMIFRTLTAFGDAASLTGAGLERMKLALLGFRQIAATGRLSMEELRQVTENLMVPMDAIIEELGIAKSDLADLGSKGIPAAKAMNAILRALERPVSKGGFAGGMAAIMNLLNQQVSILKDNLQVNFVERWGKGIESVVTPAIKDLNKLFDENRATVKQWGNILEYWGRLGAHKFVTGIKSMGSSLKEFFKSDKWRDADTLSEKAAVFWDFLKDGFDSWWSRNQGLMKGTFSTMGGFLGGAIKGAILTALGIIDPSSSISDDPFIGAGQQAGKAFMDGFLKELDAGEIAGKIGQAFLNIQPWNASSFGEFAFGTIVDLLALNAIFGLGKKTVGRVKDIKNFGRGIRDFGRKFKDAKWFRQPPAPPTPPNTTGTLVYRGPGASTPTTTKKKGLDVIDLSNPVAPIPPYVDRIASGGTLMKIGKRIPLLGTALNLLSLGTAQNSEEVIRGIAGIVGSVALGALGSLAGPGGTIAGGVAGGFLADKLVDLIMGGDSAKETSHPVQLPVQETKSESQPPIEISVTLNPTFQISTAVNAEDVLRIIRANLHTLSDEVAEAVADKLEHTYNNIPFALNIPR